MKNRKLWVAIMAAILALIMLMSIILPLLPAAQAASSSEIKEQISALEEEKALLKEQMEELRAQQKENVTQTRDILTQKNLIDQQIGLMHIQIKTMNDQIAAYAVLIADKQKDLDEAQERLEKLTQENKARIRAMEEEGSLSYWSVLFQANSFTDLLDRLNMIEEIAAADRRRLQEMSKVAKEVEEAKAVLVAEKAGLENARAELLAAQAELDAQSAKSQKLLNDLLAKGEEYEALIEELEHEDDDLLKELANKKQEYDDAKYSEYMATATQPTTAPPVVGGAAGGAPVDISGMTWLVPVSYTMVTSPYGWRIHPISGVRKFHHGVDLAGGGINGKPIVASRGGRVIFAGWYGSGGWTIGIDHGDGFQSYYLHMTNYIVAEGDYVAAGQTIGYVGSTGGSTGPHLHFEIRYNGASVNPMDYIG